MSNYQSLKNEALAKVMISAVQSFAKAASPDAAARSRAIVAGTMVEVTERLRVGSNRNDPHLKPIGDAIKTITDRRDPQKVMAALSGVILPQEQTVTKIIRLKI